MAPAATSETWVVAGAARGIGAALVEETLKRDGTRVYAGARRVAASTKLADLKSKYGDRLQLITLDVTDVDSAKAAAKAIKDAGLAVDVLVNNAATLESMTVATRDQDPKVMLGHINTNALGAHITTQAFLPLLERGHRKIVVNTSSMAGSNTAYASMVHSDDSPFKGFSKAQAIYRMSKAALNSLTISWALDLTPDQGFTFVAIHPGVVKTELFDDLMGQLKVNPDDLTGVVEMLTPPESAQAIAKVISGLQPKDSGKFLDYKGNDLPY